VTIGGRETDLPGSLLDAFAASLRGELIRPGDASYEPGRELWNGMIDRRPALVACCSGVEDVAAAVDFARDNELPLAVGRGGHGVAGHALCDGGLVIDLSGMTVVEVDLRHGRRVRRAAVGWETSTAHTGCGGWRCVDQVPLTASRPPHCGSLFGPQTGGNSRHLADAANCQRPAE